MATSDRPTIQYPYPPFVLGLPFAAMPFVSVWLSRQPALSQGVRVVVMVLFSLVAMLVVFGIAGLVRRGRPPLQISRRSLVLQTAGLALFAVLANITCDLFWRR